MINGKTVVYTAGTFDLFHYGHLLLLKRAKALGDYLIVSLSTDEFNKIKNKQSFFDYNTRKSMLEGIKYIDEIIPEETWEQKIPDIKSHNVDIFVMGDDWEGKFDELKEYCEVVYLPRTPNVSTTQLKEL